MTRDELELHAKSLEAEIAEAEIIITQAKYWLSSQSGNKITGLHSSRGLRQEIDEQEIWIDRYKAYLHEVRRQLGLHGEDQSSQRHRD